MARLTSREIKILDGIFQMTNGYVLDFSNQSFNDFIFDAVKVDMDEERFKTNGSSKAKRLKTFIEIEEPYKVKILLQSLWNYRKEKTPPEPNEESQFNTILNKFQSGINCNSLHQLKKKTKILNLDTVKNDLDRALNSISTDPESAITSACSTLESVCRSIIISLNSPLPQNKDLKTLFKTLIPLIGIPNPRKEISQDIINLSSGLTTVIGAIGALRTHGGDAHGRESGYVRLDQNTAKLAVNSAISISIFLIGLWESKHPTKHLELSK